MKSNEFARAMRHDRRNFANLECMLMHDRSISNGAWIHNILFWFFGFLIYFFLLSFYLHNTLVFGLKWKIYNMLHWLYLLSCVVIFFKNWMTIWHKWKKSFIIVFLYKIEKNDNSNKNFKWMPGSTW
jgi:hypothetical protein